MKKNTLKARLRQAFDSQTPELLPRIEASCRTSPQESAPVTPCPAPVPLRRARPAPWLRRAVACGLCLVFFFSGLALGHFIPTSPAAVAEAASLVYLDVNPSIELQLDEKQQVLSCIAGNSDAEALLADLSLTGTDLNTALTALVGSLYLHGYLSAETNSLLVSVDGLGAEPQPLLSAISDKISRALSASGIECSIIAQEVTADDTLRHRAESLGVSVGKLHLVDKMVSGMEELSGQDKEALSHMSIHQLNLMYSTRPHEGEEDPFGGDLSTGQVGGFLSPEAAWELLLTEYGWDPASVAQVELRTAPQGDPSGDMRMVYRITVFFKSSPPSHFLVDCVTGEVSSLSQDPSEGPPGEN